MLQIGHMSVYWNDLHVPSRKNKPHTHVLMSPHSGMRTPHPEEAPRFQSQVQ